MALAAAAVIGGLAPADDPAARPTAGEGSGPRPPISPPTTAPKRPPSDPPPVLPGPPPVLPGPQPGVVRFEVHDDIAIVFGKTGDRIAIPPWVRGQVNDPFAVGSPTDRLRP